MQVLSKKQQKNVFGMLAYGGNLDDGTGTCKKKCEEASKNSDCCGGITVSGDYPSCPNSGGKRVCM